MQEILLSIPTSQLKWNIVSILIKHSKNDNKFLLLNLRNILKSKYELFENRFTAAEILTQLNDQDGLKFISDVILNKPNLAYTYRHRFNSISNQKNHV